MSEEQGSGGKVWLLIQIVEFVTGEKVNLVAEAFGSQEEADREAKSRGAQMASILMGGVVAAPEHPGGTLAAGKLKVRLKPIAKVMNFMAGQLGIVNLDYRVAEVPLGGAPKIVKAQPSIIIPG